MGYRSIGSGLYRRNRYNQLQKNNLNRFSIGFESVSRKPIRRLTDLLARLGARHLRHSFAAQRIGSAPPGNDFRARGGLRNRRLPTSRELTGLAAAGQRGRNERSRFEPVPAHHRHTQPSSPLVDKELVTCIRSAISR